MDNVDDASTNLDEVYPDGDIPIDIEDWEIYNYKLVKRVSSKLREFLKDTKSNVFKVGLSNLSFSTVWQSDTCTGMQAAAMAAELEVKLQYMHTGLGDVLQMLERLPGANCMDGFMQGDSVHNPGNEVDSRFEGNGVLHHGGCFGIIYICQV